MRPKDVKKVEHLSKESPWHSRMPVLELTSSSNAKTLPLPFHPDLRERVLVFLTLHSTGGELEARQVEATPEVFKDI